MHGTLQVNSQPAAGALVILHPPNGSEADWPTGFPHGTVNADGTFDVETYGDKDGAPEGEYTILISWDQQDPQNEEAPAVDRLGGRYSNASKSQLKAKVEAKPTELPPIQLR